MAGRADSRPLRNASRFHHTPIIRHLGYGFALLRAGEFEAPFAVIPKRLGFAFDLRLLAQAVDVLADLAPTLFLL